MGYDIALTSLANEALDSVPNYVRERAAGQLSILAEYPTLLSRPSDVPLMTDCQLFVFQVEHLADRWTISVLFKYAADEQTLIVIGIGRTFRDRADADEDEGPAI